MAPDCVVLSDSTVHELLIGLSKSDIALFQAKHEDILKKFSVEVEERRCQPEPGIVNRSNGQKTLFRPFTSPTGVGTKIIVHPAPEEGQSQAPLHGILVICDNAGIPTGLINAEEITGFRTSMSAIIPWTWRRRTETIVVFGAGKQALWHIRLVLALRHDEVKSIAIVNRSETRAKSLIDQVSADNNSHWRSEAELLNFILSDPSNSESIKSQLAKADAIFCTVPSEEPLFSLEDLKLNQGDRTPPYISAIGSWQANMIELDPALLKYAVRDEAGFNPRGDIGGVIIVDDSEGASKHSGEIVQSGLKEDRLVELGKILELRGQDDTSIKHQKLTEWLQEGLVLFKSIGVSLTDLAAGQAILEVANKQNLGITIPGL